MTQRRRRFARSPIEPERVRRIAGGFCFLPHRFLRDGFFASLSMEELLLYFLLVLAGDRNGVSFYGQDTLCSLLELPMHSYLKARNGLIEKDLVAFDGRRFQVLSLPARVVRMAAPALTTARQLAERDPATIRQLATESLAEAAGRER